MFTILKWILNTGFYHNTANGLARIHIDSLACTADFLYNLHTVTIEESNMSIKNCVLFLDYS